MTAPQGDAFDDFLHGVFVGLTGLDGAFVRPRFQLDPPSTPEPGVNWLAFGINRSAPDASAYFGQSDGDSITMQRHETVTVAVFCYGPQAAHLADAIRDNLELAQNREELYTQAVGYSGVISDAQRVPELVKGRWYNRVDLTLAFNREIRRSYQVLSLASAFGQIVTDNGHTRAIEE
jgi:hypothetical protein